MQVTHEDETDQDPSGADESERDDSAEAPWLAKKNPIFSEDAKDTLLLVFGVILPVCAVAFELAFHFCARYFFDPFPSTNHVVLFSLIPISNLMAWMSRRANLTPHFAFMSLSSGMAMGVALMYALMFLPLTGPATFSIVYLGFGLLGLTPLLSLPCLWFSGKRVCHMADQRRTYFEAHQLKHFGHIVVLVMVLAVELPSTLTRMNLDLAVHPETEKQGVEWLRRFGNQEVLLRACYERSGRATDILGSMYEAGHPIKIEEARRIFYRVTGKPFNSVPIPASARSTIQHRANTNDPAGLNAVIEDEFDLDADVAGEQVSGVVRGLNARDSQMQVEMQPDALVAKIDWSFHFGNTSKYDREARGKIMLPPGAVVTRATLTVAGVEHDATIMVREAARAIYQEAVKQHKEDPLLVSTCGPDQILVQCFPVHPGGDLKVALHIVAPMVLGQRDSEALLNLPTFLERNFQLDETTAFNASSKGFTSSDEKLPFQLTHFTVPKQGQLVLVPNKETVTGVEFAAKIASDQLGKNRAVLTATRNDKYKEIDVEDALQAAPIRHKVQRELITPPPQLLTVLIDGSVSMKDSMNGIANGLRQLPKGSRVRILILSDEPLSLMDVLASPGSPEFEKALSKLAEYKPVGGQDNSAPLLEVAAQAQSDPTNAILWVHGAQPLCEGNSQTLASYLNLRKVPLLYDLQVAPGPVEVLTSAKNSTGFRHVYRTGSVENDIALLARSWIEDTVSPSTSTPPLTSPAAPAAAVPKADRELAQLLAYNRLIRNLQSTKQHNTEANALAKNYHLVSPISSAVVVDEIVELNSVSKPAPKPEPKPDPVIDAKNLLDHSFDHFDSFLAFTKYELIDREVDPILKSMHPGTALMSSITADGGYAQRPQVPNPVDMVSGSVQKSFDTVTSQLNKLNSVSPGPDSFDSTSSSSVGGSTSRSGEVFNSSQNFARQSTEDANRLADSEAVPRSRHITLADSSSGAPSFPPVSETEVLMPKVARDEVSIPTPIAPKAIEFANDKDAEIRIKERVAPPIVTDFRAKKNLAANVQTDGSGLTDESKFSAKDEQAQSGEKRISEKKFDANQIAQEESFDKVNALNKQAWQSEDADYSPKRKAVAQGRLGPAGRRDSGSASDGTVIVGVNTAGSTGGDPTVVDVLITGRHGSYYERTSIPGTSRIDSMAHSSEHRHASRALTMLSLIFSAATALITLKNAQVRTPWIYCRSVLLLVAMPCVFYVLGNFLVPYLEHLFKASL